MALSRVSAATFSSIRPIIHSGIASSRSCTSCLRQTPFRSSLQATIRRTQATATAHRVQDIPSQPPPPRNAGIPETSIAGGQPQIENTTDASLNQIPHTAGTKNSDISITEGEAQHSPITPTKSTTTSSTSSPSSTSTSTRPQRPSRLRARKAAMTLTQGAVEQLRALLAQPEPKLIRVGVKNRGCSGLAYHLEYVEKPGTFDESVEQDGVKVLIDSKALFSIIGSEMDWAEDKLSQRFVFRNPNITEQCGCGESFSIG